MLVAVLVVILIVSCGTLVVYGPSFNWFAATGEQVYEGNINRTALFALLTNESFDPRISTTATNVTLLIHPFCGSVGTTEAKRSQNLMSPTYSKIFFQDNLTRVSITTFNYDSKEKGKKELTDEVRCVFTKMRPWFETNLGQHFIQEDVDYRQTTPGFETAVVVTTVMLVSFIIYRRKKAYLKK